MKKSACRYTLPHALRPHVIVKTDVGCFVGCASSSSAALPKSCYLLKCTFEKVALPLRNVQGIIPLLFTRRYHFFRFHSGVRMTELPDDKLLPGPLARETGDALSIGGQARALNPAMAYLISLPSAASRQTMRSFLQIVAGMLGAKTLQHCPWGSLRRHHIQGLLEMLSASGRAPATINTYLSALKGTRAKPG
ncbi:integrase/recombinase [Cronobacter dublinensis 1210]|uniref:Integrase/recombinase n=1 Tax=Cronobacter dublinensis 1210 TaxID=1208656 RepID=A0ABM9QAT0_9ENTR|nr:integrase/recombinase [Cronobacter dublinensis 1210]